MLLPDRIEVFPTSFHRRAHFGAESLTTNALLGIDPLAALIAFPRPRALPVAADTVEKIYKPNQQRTLRKFFTYVELTQDGEQTCVPAKETLAEEEAVHVRTWVHQKQSYFIRDGSEEIIAVKPSWRILQRPTNGVAVSDCEREVAIVDTKDDGFMVEEFAKGEHRASFLYEAAGSRLQPVKRLAMAYHEPTKTTTSLDYVPETPLWLEKMVTTSATGEAGDIEVARCAALYDNESDYHQVQYAIRGTHRGIDVPDGYGGLDFHGTLRLEYDEGMLAHRAVLCFINDRCEDDRRYLETEFSYRSVSSYQAEN